MNLLHNDGNKWQTTDMIRRYIPLTPGLKILNYITQIVWNDFIILWLIIFKSFARTFYQLVKNKRSKSELTTKSPGPLLMSCFSWWPVRGGFTIKMTVYTFTFGMVLNSIRPSVDTFKLQVKYHVFSFKKKLQRRMRWINMRCSISYDNVY